MTNKWAVFGLSVLVSAGPLVAAERVESGSRQSFQETSTEHLKFGPGGTIRVNDSYGHLTVEGWDEPEVWITLIKSTKGFYEPSRKREASQRFEMIQVSAESRSATELAIATTRASRHGTWAPPLPNTTFRRHPRISHSGTAQFATVRQPRLWVRLGERRDRRPRGEQPHG